MLVVPACHHHQAFEAIIDPLLVTTVTPCTEEEAVAFADAPASMREPPAA